MKKLFLTFILAICLASCDYTSQASHDAVSSVEDSIFTEFAERDSVYDACGITEEYADSIQHFQIKDGWNESSPLRNGPVVAK